MDALGIEKQKGRFSYEENFSNYYDNLPLSKRALCLRVRLN
jgi:hypothetical protein